MTLLSVRVRVCARVCAHVCVCVYMPHVFYPFICQWTLRLLPCPGYCK